MGIEAVAAKLRRREAASSVPAGERLRCTPVGNATDNVRQLFSSPFNIQVANSLNPSGTIQKVIEKMTAMKAANKELKGMMKAARIEDMDSMQDEMVDLMDVSNEIK
ncbi:hypothetical protein VPH35_062773 [Triticum aestivum]|uniref:Charged multivesicular body protein 5 n=1 Tax=Aegilops tauschii TaxID=37682 RepID=M8BQI3_AEGTA